MNQINNAQNQRTHHVTKIKKRNLKEQKISPKDLIEIDAEMYKEMKS